MQNLAHHLQTGLCEIPKTALNGHSTQKIASTINISFLGLSAESLVIALDQAGISISTGSACATGSTQPSHVLEAMSLSPDRIQSAVRFSLGLFTTLDEIKATLQIVQKTVYQLRKLSQ